MDSPPPEGSLRIAAQRRNYGTGRGEAVSPAIAVETPVAIEINGIAYAVMMATPLDVEDFVTGFILAEALAEVHEIEGIAVHAVDGGDWGAGLVARVNLPHDRMGPILERARRRLGDSSCGICGIEGIEQALRPLPRLAFAPLPEPPAIQLALDAMGKGQALGRETAATHAAAFCSLEGAVIALREDVGRHNALDKLVGALARQGIDPAAGFIVLSSRCSYELVEKTVRAGCPLLVTISAPTDLAVRRARGAGLTLAVVARSDTMLWIDPDNPGII